GVLEEAARSVSDFARLSDRAEGIRAAQACRETFTVSGYLRDVASRKRGEGEMRELHSKVIEDLLLYHEYRAFAAKNVEICDLIAPVEKHYFGISRTAAWGCREWFWDMSAADALKRSAIIRSGTIIRA
ncbi:MAG: hypothetical protein ABL955_15070, partial [Elusimicrobiota bacterium]